MSADHIHNLKELLREAGHPDRSQIIPLPTSGSNRNYYRVVFPENNIPASLIASYNNDVRENIAQYSFTTHFISLGINVPEIYARDRNYHYFLMQDLGDITLFSLLNNVRSRTIEYYKNVIDDLVKFQIQGIKNLNLDVAYPVKKFNMRSVMWDLNYFKYYFVKPLNINFDENRLEDNFFEMAEQLLSTETNYFNYRDFQSRNIMVHNYSMWYIDFQGGRQGPLQYDLISLLYQVRANLSDDTRKVLYNHYIETLNNTLPGKQEMFEKHYTDFIYFRLMQVMGAYGFRGIFQRKAHFLQSIPMAIKSLSDLMQKSPLSENLSELNSVLKQISSLDYHIPPENDKGLTIQINSFSYKKKGIPADITGNGGGHVFDCRSLPNPGRITGLRDYTGLQKPVINYLGDQQEVSEFLRSTLNIIEQSISNYQKRKFSNLQVNFGCTGGRHRSVYCASTIADYIRSKFTDVIVKVNHFEIDDSNQRTVGV
ncbi:MAG: phosphotransferase [Bacteroidetes bacterium]|nr:phosphotransferase [Bacteroidota bacterium]